MIDDLFIFQNKTHEFARNIMKPIGKELDRLPAEKVVEEHSRFWEYRQSYSELGIDVSYLSSVSSSELPALFSVLFEELGWGDAGLAVSAGVDLLPHYMARKYGNQYVAQKYPESMIGCWAITEPEHGSDMLDASGGLFHPQGVYGVPDCVARISDGKIIINGRKSSWVSNGPVAELCLLYCAAETINGIDTRRGAIMVVPLNVSGVSKGAPLEKMGQRSLPQGEIIFDNVEVDIDHLLVAPEEYVNGVTAVHSEANLLMGNIFTGVARAAYELAHAFAHERIQGGVPIIRHQNVASRLFHMARKVEISRALSRRMTALNMFNDRPALHAAMFAKVTATQLAFEVASEAVQIFGGQGVTFKAPVEKIFRDARSSLIEDGCNEMLSVKGGSLLENPSLFLNCAENQS